MFLRSIQFYCRQQTTKAFVLCLTSLNKPTLVLKAHTTVLLFRETKIEPYFIFQVFVNYDLVSKRVTMKIFRGQEVKDEAMEEEVEELKKKDNEENVELDMEQRDLSDCKTKIEKQERMAMLLLQGDKT